MSSDSLRNNILGNLLLILILVLNLMLVFSPYAISSELVVFIFIFIALINIFALIIIFKVPNKINSKWKKYRLNRRVPALKREFDLILERFAGEFTENPNYRPRYFLTVIGESFASQLFQLLPEKHDEYALFREKYRIFCDWFSEYFSLYRGFNTIRKNKQEFLRFVRRFISILVEYDRLIENLTNFIDKLDEKLEELEGNEVDKDAYRAFTHNYGNFQHRCKDFFQLINNELNSEISLDLNPPKSY